LKNAIDNVFVSFSFRNKVAAFVGYSGGVGAGVRAVEHLVHVCVEAELMPLRSTVLIPHVGGAFDGDGAPVNAATSLAARIMLEDLAWWGNLLHTGRLGEVLPPAAMRALAAAGHAPRQNGDHS
jgi:NAD(P)H-dependent FMN reductase